MTTTLSLLEVGHAHEMTVIATTVGCDDFQGEFCDLGFDADLAITAHVDNRCPHEIVTYYVQSLPKLKRVSQDAPMVQAFQRACDEWQKYSGVQFQQVSKDENPMFIIRAANLQEEDEEKDMIARSFFWSQRSKHRIKIWKSIEDWNAYSVFLHEVGHILGFRHDHIFLLDDERTGITATAETNAGVQLLQPEAIVDRESIMSYGYLKAMKDRKKEARLSTIDKTQCRQYYHDSN